MSVINFPLLLNVCLAIVMSGCAANKQTVIPAADEMSEQTTGHKVSNCRSTQRDLTTPWSLRQYWCGEENRKGDLQNINNNLVDQVAVNHSPTDQAYIDDVNNEVNQLNYDVPIVDTDKPVVTISPSKNKEDAINRLKGIEKSMPISNLSLEKVHLKTKRNTALTSIIFAHHLQVLGPEGRAATHALLNQVSSSNNVRIRGLILADEVLVDSNLYREQVSVARALAVRKYWKDQGLDTSHVMILHYNPELSGRTVEVTFHG
jgi:hypothetical protein